MCTRAGRYVTQLAGYRAFVPKPLPPDPPVRWNADLVRLLSEADLAVGRLDGLARSLPNPDLFVAMYVRREAVLSSQIEGTQSSLEDLLAFEIDVPGMVQPVDVAETVNYVKAMNTGLRLLPDVPLSGASHPDDPQGTPHWCAWAGTSSGAVPHEAELDRTGRLHHRDGDVRTSQPR